MFHRPSSNIGGPSNVMSVSRQRSLVSASSSQNENVHLTAKAAASDSATSTPAKPLPRNRRAFGDISNKKATNGGGGGGNGKDKGTTPSTNKIPVMSEPRSSNTSFTPGNKSNTMTKQRFESRIPKTVVSSKQPLSKRAHPYSAQTQQNGSRISVPNTVNARVTSPAPSTHRKVDFVLPSSKRQVEKAETKEPEATAMTQAKPTPQAKMLEPVDDVELPAGRLWVEQLELDDPLGEDDLSTSSMGETLDKRTMWDDWRDTMVRQWEEERLKRDLDDEREVKAQLDKVLQDDEQEVGLESLYDGVDALHLNDPDDLDLDALLEDDDWSQPASSIDGALNTTFEM